MEGDVGAELSTQAIEKPCHPGVSDTQDKPKSWGVRGAEFGL